MSIQHLCGLFVHYPGERAPPSESPAPFPEAPARSWWSPSTLLTLPYAPDRAIDGTAHMKTNILQVTEQYDTKYFSFGASHLVFCP